MLIDKEKDIKIAENREEKVFYKFKEQLEGEIKDIKLRIDEDKKVLKMNMKEIYKKTREGINRELEILKDNLEVKEFVLNNIKEKFKDFKINEFNLK
jgi:hypothetical protein